MIAALTCTLAFAPGLAAAGEPPLPVTESGAMPELAPAADRFAVRAAEIHLGDGQVLEDGVVLVDAGKISRVGRGVEIPAGLPVVDHDGVLTAGMIACHDYSGAAGDNHDPTRPLMAEARMVYAFQPRHSDFRRAVEHGITSVVLAPSPENPAGGLTAVVKTAGGGVVKADAHLALSISQAALSYGREPTSYPGALAHLDGALRAAEGVWAEAAAGRLPVLVEAHARHEIVRALAFAADHGLRGALRGAPLAGELLELVQESGFAVVHAPMGANASDRAIRAAVRLGESGVPFAFSLDQPWSSPHQLRLAVARLTRAGLDGAILWRALTSGAAEIAGVSDRIGSIEPGRDADFILWSGNPLELTTQIEAVYVDGERAFGGNR